MGYSTRYHITFTAGAASEQQIFLQAVKTLIGYNPFEDAVTWYDWHENLQQCSAIYPELEFYVDGQGEEGPDRWRCFFKAGKSELHKQPKWEPPSKPDNL